MGRFISKDSIGLLGGHNVYAYAPNPVGWIDPLGLSGNCPPNNFASEKALQEHFEKHGGEFKDHGVTNSQEYLKLGQGVVKDGYKVEYSYKGKNMKNAENRTGYIQLMGNSSKGDAKFAFVGTNLSGNITTIHTKSGKDVWKTLNNDSSDKTIRSLK